MSRFRAFVVTCSLIPTATGDEGVSIREVVSEAPILEGGQGARSHASLTFANGNLIFAWTVQLVGAAKQAHWCTSQARLDGVLGFGAHADVASDGRARWAASWSVFERGSWVAYLRLQGLAPGPVIGTTVRVDPIGSDRLIVSSVAMYSNGDALVVWNRSGNGRMNYYWQLFDARGLGRGSPVRLDEGNAVDVAKVSVGVAVAEIGERREAFVVWDEWTDANTVAVVGRRIEPDACHLGSVVEFDRSGSAGDPRRPKVDMNNRGEVVVAWLRERVEETTVFAQKLNRNNASAAPPVDIDGNQHYSQDLIVPALFENGAFALAWTRREASGGDVLLSVYDPSSEALTHRPYVVSNGLTRRTEVQQRPALAKFAEERDSVLLAVAWENETLDGSSSNAFSEVLKLSFGVRGH